MTAEKLMRILGFQGIKYSKLHIVDAMWELGRHSIPTTALIAINYGIILGKQEERARRKKREQRYD